MQTNTSLLLVTGLSACLLFNACSENKQQPKLADGDSTTVEQPAIAAQKAADELAEVANVAKDERNIPDDNGNVAPAPPAIPNGHAAPAQNPAAAANAPHPAALTREPYRPADPPISMHDIPATGSLSQRKGMSWMYQRGNWWCIPATLENCFRYVGIWDVKQDQIVKSYVNIYGKGSWFDFNSGARAASALVDLKSRGLQFEVVPAPDLDTFYRKIKHAIANNWPCVIAYEIGGGNAHVVNVVGYGEDWLDVYNPATAKMEFMRFSDIKIGGKPAYLVLRPVSKPKQQQ